jgi:hypothetical protein
VFDRSVSCPPIPRENDDGNLAAATVPPMQVGIAERNERREG